jgi:predicted ferric reductase
MPVTVEGPYDRFDFEDGKRRQIWVGAGIGITPFIVRMKQLAGAPSRTDRSLPFDRAPGSGRS